MCYQGYRFYQLTDLQVNRQIQRNNENNTINSR